MNNDITAEEARNMKRDYTWSEVMGHIESIATKGLGRYISEYDPSRWPSDFTEGLTELGYKVTIHNGKYRVSWDE